MLYYLIVFLLGFLIVLTFVARTHDLRASRVLKVLTIFTIMASVWVAYKAVSIDRLDIYVQIALAIIIAPILSILVVQMIKIWHKLKN